MIRVVLAALAQLMVAAAETAALALRIVSADAALVDFAAIDRQKAHERIGRVM
jgi:hypothetical protein